MESLQETLNERIKQAYYYLDYLRLHRLGRKLKMFPKNRQMMDPTEANDPKKGYKAYIHRMYQTFIKHDFEYLSNVKPRNEFGYNFGVQDRQLEQSNGGAYKCINLFASPENMLLYLFRRHMLYKENNPLINEYLQVFNTASYVKARTMNMFYLVRFGDKNPGAYAALREMYQVRDKHFAILETYNVEEHIKNNIHALLTSISKVNRSQKFYRIEREGVVNTAREEIIDGVQVSTDTNGYVTAVQISNRNRSSFNRSNIVPINDGSNNNILEEVKFAKETTEAFLAYLMNQISTAQGLNLNQIYTLSRSFYVPGLDPQARAVVEALDFDDIEESIRVKMSERGLEEHEYLEPEDEMPTEALNENGDLVNPFHDERPTGRRIQVPWEQAIAEPVEMRAHFGEIAAVQQPRRMDAEALAEIFGAAQQADRAIRETQQAERAVQTRGRDRTETRLLDELRNAIRSADRDRIQIHEARLDRYRDIMRDTRALIEPDDGDEFDL